jgi:tetratricopeptide (TPR) repeat protein
LAATLFALYLAQAAAAVGQVVITHAEREQQAAELRRYRALVNAYRGGDNAAVKTILAWDPKRLDAIVTTVNTRDDPTGPWTNEQFKAAAMLHTDAAMERLYEDEPRVGFELNLAGRLLEKGPPELLEFTREWYSAVARRLRGVVLFTIAERLLEDGRTRLPNDPVVLFESGLLHEQIASFAAFLTQVDVPDGPPARMGGPLQTHGTFAINPGRHPSVAEQRRALNSAADRLGESLAVEPANEQAQLHLGRVQILRGNRDGSKLLEKLAQSSRDTATAYLATMFLAAMDAREGRHGSAEKRYRAAIEKLPSAQSAYVGLSETLQRLGRGDESREVIHQVLVRPSNSTKEPWWWYVSDPQDAARRRIAALRDAVRK